MHIAAAVSFLRHPRCPYPQLAVYKGTGDTNLASNFVCKSRNVVPILGACSEAPSHLVALRAICGVTGCTASGSSAKATVIRPRY